MSISDIPLRKKLALSLFSRYKAAEAKIHRLNYILWECTLRCNLSCLHCGSDCKKDSSICDMPAKDFLGALDSITDILEPNNTMNSTHRRRSFTTQRYRANRTSIIHKRFPLGHSN